MIHDRILRLWVQKCVKLSNISTFLITNRGDIYFKITSNVVRIKDDYIFVIFVNAIDFTEKYNFLLLKVKPIKLVGSTTLPS